MMIGVATYFRESWKLDFQDRFDIVLKNWVFKKRYLN